MKLIQGAFEQISRSRIGKIDLVFADPPDNTGVKYEGYHDVLSTGEYHHLMVAWLRQAKSLCNGPIFWCFNEKWTWMVEEIIRSLDIPLIQRCYWYWTFGQNQRAKYTPSVRPVYWLNGNQFYPNEIKVPSARQTKYHDRRAEPSGRVPDNVWQISRVCGTFKERRAWHPCQIPEALIERIVLGHSQAGQAVLDPFMGSGATGRVCLRTHRQCVGIEISPSFCKKIKKELSILGDQ